MVKIDLITGFLGSGKTTFLRKYASYLMEQGLKIGILENDFGAVNVDRMLLLDLEGENCDLEMVAGACHADCHKRRFKTKLISLGMSGLDRVVVEPSGVYEVDEFFDTLAEEPLNHWYEIGSVITVVDANLEDTLSEEAEYLLASQLSCAGQIVLSKSQYTSEEERKATITRLHNILVKYGCRRSLDDGILTKPWDDFTAEDFQRIVSCGYDPQSYKNLGIAKETVFASLYFINLRLSHDELRQAIKDIFADSRCGQVFRIKGFMKTEEDTWLEVNATSGQLLIEPINAGQEILIVIGEALDKEAIRAHLPGAEDFV